MNSLTKYYELLGLKPGAGEAEIKKAYRELAKKFHPDVCADANAHERFVKLTEAYEILTDRSQRKVQTRQTFNRAEYYKAYQEEQRRREAAAKRKAEQAARMKYEEFINSDYYKTELYTHVLIDHFLFLLAVFLIFILPAIMTTMIGIEGLIGSIVVALVTSPLTFKPLMNFRKMNFELAWDGIKFLSRNKKFAGFILFAATVFLFFNAAFRTEISNLTFSVIFLGLPVLALVFCFSTSKNEIRQHPFYYAFVIVPLIITLLLNLNYYISFAEEAEKYRYTVTEFTARKKGGGIETVTQTIYLPGKKYDNCSALRLFYGTACEGNTVVMHFRRGFLGLRVVKNFEFTYQEYEAEI